jgi:hypothetical protein
MSIRSHIALAAIAAFGLTTGHAGGQVIGSFDNFDVFNDTGQTAEGFEIDVEDVAPADLTREFPSNFAQAWLIRYGLPTVTAYDFTKSTPDAAHSYDAGHKGVLITWAASLQGGKWVAPQGHAPGAPGASGDGTPYNPNPTLTAGESCWWYGLGAAYPASGCDHFGISFGPGVAPGKMTYHWKVPDPTNTVLVNARLEASIPPSPILAPAPVAAGAAPVVKAVAKAPVDFNQDPYQPQKAEPQYGDAIWLKTTTLYSTQRAVLENLQKKVLAQNATKKIVTWTLLQRAPGVGPNAGKGEREAAEKDGIGGKNVQVTKQYEYYKFSGAYDSETHQALCDLFYSTQAATLQAIAGGNPKPSQVSCQNAGGSDTPFTKPYWTIDPGPLTAIGPFNGNLGGYIGAHVNAYNIR